MVYKRGMKRFFITTLSVVWLTVAAWAHPSGDLLGRILAIADADQVRAFHQLHLSSFQQQQLRQAAYDFAPRFEQMRNIPGGPALLVPEALAKVEGILTPEQRPLARKLVPRAHQWSKLKALYQEYQQ